MEKSIKRVEKLVHATNSALAQMKFSLMFDDMKEDLAGKSQNAKIFEPTDGFIDGDDLKLCQDEFKAEANEMLAKVETMFKSRESSRRNSKAVDRIKEINRKMNKLRLEPSKPAETEESRKKLLSLIAEEKFSPRKASPEKEFLRSKLPVLKRHREKTQSNLKKTDSTLTITVAQGKTKEELREKIMETQEIVNRGFQTARQLSQKVESMTKCEKKEKTPSSEKTGSDMYLRSLDEKSDSNETVQTTKCRRCAREKKRKDVEAVEKVNARVIDVKRNDFRRSKMPNLQYQRLPSLHIRGELQMQRVHNLEIPAGGDVCDKSNTAVSFLSHDDLEKEKFQETVDKVRKEHFCNAVQDLAGNYVECFNCGKLIRIRRTRADPRQVDEILQKCNYNVFDPRIDEFAEKCGAVSAFNLCESTEAAKTNLPSNRSKVPEESNQRQEKTKEKSLKRSRRHTIQDLSNRLLRKYKEEADTIEGNHLKLDTILQNLFRKVDESREIFEDCHLLRTRKLSSARAPVLTATKPVLISLDGTKGRKRHRRWDLGRKTGTPEVKAETEGGLASVICVAPNENAKSEEPGRRLGPTAELTKQPEMVKQEVEERSSTTCSYSSKSESSVRGRKESIQLRIVKELDRIAKKEEMEKKLLLTSTTNKPTDVKHKEVEKQPEEISPPSSRVTKEYNKPLKIEEKSKKDNGRARTVEEKPSSETLSEKSENNYESDFESMTNDQEEIGDEYEDEEPEINPRAEKLSTISEVDSDLEKKLSDELKTGRNASGNKQKEEISTRSKKTEATPPKSETPAKSTPTELVTSLKDILSALQDQFARTESLAEKLTENAKIENGKEKSKMETSYPGDVMLSPWRMPDGVKLVENLQSARKDFPKSPKGLNEDEKSGRSKKSGDSMSDDGGSSLGEIILCDRKRKISGKSESSSVSESSFLKLNNSKRRWDSTSGFKPDINNEDGLYSEGEIPSDELLVVERSQTGSLGEVLSGKNSIASSID